MEKIMKSYSTACGAFIFLLALCDASSTESDMTKDDAWKFFNKFGYMTKPLGDYGDEAAAYRQLLLDMQYMAGINQTGVLDEDTKKLMATPRCSVSDHTGHNNDARRRRRKRYSAQGSIWKNREITYAFNSFTNQLDQASQKSTLQKALQFWSRYSTVTFKETSPANTDIQISFVRRDHGDCCAFDGRSGILAHAFFPAYGGDAHFDDDELWTLNSNSGTNLLQVAIHEFGHSLGLGHSNVPGAIMYAYYTGYIPDPQLSADDIAGIQYLYGPPNSGISSTSTTRSTTTATTPRSSIAGGSTQSSTTTTKTTTTTRVLPAICSNPKIDAIVVAEGVTYVFSDYDYYVLLDGNGIAPGYPKRINSFWTQFNGKVDAALYTPRETIRDANGNPVIREAYLYLFQGNQYWRYVNVNQLEAGFPKPIRNGFPGIPDNIDAAFQWSGNGRIFFIKGGNYYRYSLGVGADAGYPKPVSLWSGVPNDVTAAFQWVNKRTYFFAGTRYYRFDDYNFKVDRATPSYPRGNGDWWFGCSGSLENGAILSEDANARNQFIEVVSSSSQLSCLHFIVILTGACFAQFIIKFV